jgi:hypothetical protein
MITINDDLLDQVFHFFMALVYDLIEGFNSLQQMSPINHLASIILFFFYCGVGLLISMVILGLVNAIIESFKKPN